MAQSCDRMMRLSLKAVTEKFLKILKKVLDKLDKLC
jgi:hypothetical protein